MKTKNHKMMKFLIPLVAFGFFALSADPMLGASNDIPRKGTAMKTVQKTIKKPLLAKRTKKIQKKKKKIQTSALPALPNIPSPLIIPVWMTPTSTSTSTSTPVVSPPPDKQEGASSTESALQNTPTSTPAVTTPVQTPVPQPPSPLSGGTWDILTQQGVFDWTNKQRADHSTSSPFVSDTQLDTIALERAKDMFLHQYFEHVSPVDGSSASTVAKVVGYDYLAIGENIALGNFGNDALLVQAWMDSPGHRANIVNAKFTQMGVAVLKGTYQDRETWIGAQIFGLPQSACPRPDSLLKEKIDGLQTQFNAVKSEALVKRNAFESMNPKTPSEAEVYNKLVDEYNTYVPILNDLSAQLKNAIALYNSQVNDSNTCINQH